MESLSNNNIHIALAFDNNYVVHIYAMLTSIFCNNKSNDIIFHTIATGISDEEKLNLRTYIRDNNCKIIFYNITEDFVKAQVEIPADSYFTHATFYRLFFPQLIDPDIKRLLYIDPDTIVIKDLKELYTMDIGNSIIGAVVDSGMGIREELGINKAGSYFNAGVMVISISNWIEENVSENVLTFVRNNPQKVPYLDQDALNATLINKWFRLENKYNLTQFDVKLQVPTKELLKDTVIIHYTSSRKPWNFLTRNKLRYLYHYYLKLSPKSNEKKYIDFDWNLKNVWIFFRIRVKEFYFNNKFDKILPIKKWMLPSWDY